MSEVQVVTGARGIRGVDPVTMGLEVSDSPGSAHLMDEALQGVGDLYYNQKTNDWIVVRNVAPLTNNNGEMMREAIRVEIKFEDGLYLLKHDDPDKELKLKKLKSLPGYGTTIRPMAEITRENKAKAQAEAIKVLSNLDDKDTLKELLLKLQSKLEGADVVKEAFAGAMNELPKPKIAAPAK